MIRYNSEQERMEACHIREEVVSAVSKELDRIITVHKHMTESSEGRERAMALPPKADQCRLVSEVLEFVIADILHKQAEQDWLFGVEMREGT